MHPCYSMQVNVHKNIYSYLSRYSWLQNTYSYIIHSAKNKTTKLELGEIINNNESKLLTALQYINNY